MQINTHENISIQLVDFKLNVIDNFEQNFRHIYDHIIEKTWKNPRFPFVGTIDPYSYTMYNSFQIPLLIDELQLLANEDKDTDFINEVSDLVGYLNKVQSHEFVRFIGD